MPGRKYRLRPISRPGTPEIGNTMPLATGQEVSVQVASSSLVESTPAMCVGLPLPLQRGGCAMQPTLTIP